MLSIALRTSDHNLLSYIFVPYFARSGLYSLICERIYFHIKYRRAIRLKCFYCWIAVLANQISILKTNKFGQPNLVKYGTFKAFCDTCMLCLTCYFAVLYIYIYVCLICLFIEHHTPTQ